MDRERSDPLDPKLRAARRREVSRRARSCAAFAPRPERPRPRSPVRARPSGARPRRPASSICSRADTRSEGSSRSSYGHEPAGSEARQDLGHHRAARGEQSLEAPLDLLAAEGLADGPPHRDVVERRDTGVRHERDRRCARLLAIAVAVLRANLGQQVRGSRLLHDVQRPGYHGPRLLLGRAPRDESDPVDVPRRHPRNVEIVHARQDHALAGAHLLDPVGPHAGQWARRALRLRGSRPAPARSRAGRGPGRRPDPASRA